VLEPTQPTQPTQLISAPEPLIRIVERIKNIEEAAQEAKIEEFVPDEQGNLRQNADAIDSSSEEVIEKFVPENSGGLPSEETRNLEGALSQEPTLLE